MSKYADRILRAMKLDASLYEEVEADKSAMVSAMVTVVLVSLAAGVGNVVSGGPRGLFVHLVVALAGWFIWAFLSYFIGTKILSEPQTRADMGELLRCTGFASAPGLIQVLGIIPGLGLIIRIVAGVWMLAAFVLAVRQALDYTSTARAVGVCLIGWILMMILNLGLAILTLGRFTI